VARVFTWRSQRASLGRPLCIHTLAALPGLPALTRSDLIAELAASTPRLRQADAELIVTTIFDQITAALAHGDRVELRGFGAFTVKRRNGPHWAQSAHPREGAGGREDGAVLPSEQYAARPAQSHLRCNLPSAGRP
jgi:integration host factor subunit beta